MSQVIIITDKQGRRYLLVRQEEVQNSCREKADVEPVLTRAQLDKMAQGRIYHPFDNSTSMYKWNYTVYPSAEHAKAASAAA